MCTLIFFLRATSAQAMMKVCALQNTRKLWIVLMPFSQKSRARACFAGLKCSFQGLRGHGFIDLFSMLSARSVLAVHRYMVAS